MINATDPDITLRRLDIHSNHPGSGLAEDVRRGLLSTPKVLQPKYFYDAHGCDLFEAITELPEYYQTRTEQEILREIADGVVARHRPSELVELGSGSSRKTVTLLDAMADAGTLERFVPFDVAPSALIEASARLAERYPDLEIHAVAGDFDHHLTTIPPRARNGRRLIAFLGGTIGNLLPAERRAFLRTLRSLLRSDDHLLIGVDLVKDVATLEAAYNDSAGVTAAFNLNVLSVINTALGADFDLDAFAHRAVYDARHEWIEMRLCSLADQSVRLARLGLTVRFAAGEQMRTEVSCKFSEESLAAAVQGAGLHLREFHTDRDRRFAVAVVARDDDLGGLFAE